MIILINGFKRSGKDFTADILTKYGFKKYYYAYYIKKIIADTFDISMEELDYFKNFEKPILTKNFCDNTIEISTWRKILQRFGTEAMKPVFGDNIWADLTHKQIIKEKVNRAVISDFRFLIEYNDAVRKFGKENIITIRIEDKNILNIDLHPSETELLNNNFKFDYVIDNTIKDVKNLEYNVKNILKDFL